MTSVDPDRRRHRRFALSLPASIVRGAAVEQGRLVDLSEQGASVTAPTTAASSTPAYLHFDLGPGVRCEATGEVVWVIPFGRDFGLGLKLAYANPEYLNYLHNLDTAPAPLRPSMLADIRDLTLRLG